ncbi:MAG: helix-turn-helix domain-containing protein [Hyphomicrobium sp.]
MDFWTANWTAFRLALTQQAVADLLGKPQSYVAKVEGLERRLDVIEFLTMARVIGFDPLPAIKSAWREIRTSSE